MLVGRGRFWVSDLWRIVFSSPCDQMLRCTLGGNEPSSDESVPDIHQRQGQDF